MRKGLAKQQPRAKKVGFVKVSFCFNSICSTLVTILSRQLCYDEWKTKNQDASLDDFEGYWKGLSHSAKRVSDFPPPHRIASNLTLPRSEIHSSLGATSLNAQVVDKLRPGSWFVITPELYESTVSSVDQPTLGSPRIWTMYNCQGRESDHRWHLNRHRFTTGHFSSS